MPATVTNSPETDTAAFKLPAPTVLVMALRKDGVLVSARIHTALRDHRSLVETAVYRATDGHVVMRTNYFAHVRKLAI